jgi:alkylation response protein AidB-like acyl-CoA dehydrogenase
MELDLDPEQEELRDGVRAVLGAECSPAAVRELVEARVAGKDARPDALWGQMVALGWPALTVPEAAGGLGLGAVEEAVVVEELGRALAPGPLLATMAQFVPAVRATAAAEQQDRFLRPVAERGAAGTLAIAEATGSVAPESVTATATPDGTGGYVLAGEKQHVFEPSMAEEVVVVARLPDTTGPDGVGSFVVPTASLEVRPVTVLDPTRELATLALAGVTVPADRVLGEPGPTTATALRRAIEESTVALAASAVGTAQAVFDLALAYAKEREQFGVPIGSFQAIKHKFADMLVLLERARALAYFAALTIAEDDPRRTASASMAKAAAGDAIERIAQEGIQIHGGIGYTWEHDVHLYVRRLQSDGVLFGSATAHRATVADLLGV